MARHAVQLSFLTLCSMMVCSSLILAKEKITFTPKDKDRHESKAASCEIQIFQDAKPVRAFTEIGVLNYHDEAHRAKDGALKLDVALPKMKASACKAGADALIDIRVTEVRRLEFAMFNVRAVAVRFDSK